MERLDEAGFVPSAPPPEPVEVMPRVREFSAAGHHGVSHLADRRGEHALVVGSAPTQAAAGHLPRPGPGRTRPSIEAWLGTIIPAIGQLADGIAAASAHDRQRI